MKKEKKSLKPKFWLFRIITYIYLPLTIALSIYMAMGNVYSIGRLEFVSIFSYIEALELMLPFVTAFLFTLSLIGLLGLTAFGRSSVMFSTFLRNLILLILIAAALLEKDIRAVYYYGPACFIGILVYLYYKHRPYLFIKGGWSIKKAKAELKKEKEKETEAAEEAPLKKEETPVKEDEGAKEEEAPAPEEKEEEKPAFALSTIEGCFPETGLLKKKQFIYAFTETGTPVKVLSSTFSIFPGKTILEIEIENTGDDIYTSSRWVIGETPFTSLYVIKPGKDKITVMIEPAVEEAAVKLVEVSSDL